jgi:hypothetical protein
VSLSSIEFSPLLLACERGKKTKERKERKKSEIREEI